jgi:DNA-binding FadR family transcriptional regulator
MFSIAFVLLLAPTAPLQDPAISAAQQKGIDAYATELQRTRSRRGGGLEPLFSAAQHVARVFTLPELGDRTIDEFPKEEVERIQRALPGLDIHIGDTIGVLVDSDYFLSLARAHGRPLDVEFFALYRRTYPQSHRAAWLVRTGPESACADFTSGELVDVYAAWRRFQRRHPQHYREAVARQLEHAADSLLAEGKTLCAQDKGLIKRELERLIASAPRDPLAARVRTRIQDLR